MDNDDIDRRLAAASDRLASLAGPLKAGEPWPLAARFDHSPETTWGPGETLAHVAEMLTYWLGEADRIVTSTEIAPRFGRSPTDDLRLGTIERDRGLPTGELTRRVQEGIGQWRRRWRGLDPDLRARRATHIALGELTVADIASRLATGHLEAHLDQLTAAVDGHPAPG